MTSALSAQHPRRACGTRSGPDGPVRADIGPSAAAEVGVKGFVVREELAGRRTAKGDKALEADRSGGYPAHCHPFVAAFAPSRHDDLDNRRPGTTN